MEVDLQKSEEKTDTGPISPASAHRRHSAMLEANRPVPSIFSFTAEERVEARQPCRSVFDSYITERQRLDIENYGDEYFVGTLIQVSLNYCVSEEGRDSTTRHIVLSLVATFSPEDGYPIQAAVDELRGFHTWVPARRAPVWDRVELYADLIVQCFFMPREIFKLTFASDEPRLAIYTIFSEDKVQWKDATGTVSVYSSSGSEIIVLRQSPNGCVDTVCLCSGWSSSIVHARHHPTFQRH